MEMIFAVEISYRDIQSCGIDKMQSLRGSLFNDWDYHSPKDSEERVLTS
jgi:hypothetical protein